MKPSPEDLVRVSSAVVALTQSCLLSPSAVIASLRASLDLYTQHAINRGFDVATAEQCERLGQAIAKKMLESDVVKKQQVQQIPLVDAAGNPLLSTTTEDAEEGDKDRGEG